MRNFVFLPVQDAVDAGSDRAIPPAATGTYGAERVVSRRVIRIGTRVSFMTTHAANGAANARRSMVEHMGVNHSCLCVLVSQEFLDRSNIVTVFQQVCRGRIKNTNRAPRKSRNFSCFNPVSEPNLAGQSWRSLVDTSLSSTLRDARPTFLSGHKPPAVSFPFGS